jgi:peptidoglycan/xylan/chitin deacetylase (PgdA/CDA1 family)
VTLLAHHEALVMSEKTSSRPRHARWTLLFRKWLRVIVVSITYYTGLAFLSGLFGAKSKVRILMYHSIAEEPSYLHSVSPVTFEKQMRFLATKCNVITLDQLVDCFNGKGSLPDNPVVITLDDGLADNYAVAYPILKKYNLPATVFVVPDWVAPRKVSQTNETRPAKKCHMTWDQIREMSHNGISIGAHTISHRSLPTLKLEEARYELLESKARVERKLGQPVKFFAYPYGAFRDLSMDIVRMVAESGYTCAVTSLSGTNGRSANLYALRRTEIEVNDGMYVFSKAMAGALDNWIVFQWLRWVSQILRGEQLNEHHHCPHAT